MMHGDVTYTDAARDTLTKVREFIKANPTVYLSTHTPEGYLNLENKTVMNLNPQVRI